MKTGPVNPLDGADVIVIRDLEVFVRVGVPDEERSTPQRLLVTLVMEQDFRSAGQSDDLGDTIDYYAVTQRVMAFVEQRSWRLIEKLANDFATLVLTEFQPRRVEVEIKKFIIPETRYVAVRISRGR